LHLVSRTDNTLALWLYVPGYIMSYRRSRQLPGVHPHNVIMHRTRIHKGVMVHHGHAVRHSLVNVSNVCDVIHGHVVVDVCDLSLIHI